MNMTKAGNVIIKGLHHRWFPNSFTIFSRIARPASDKFIIDIQVSRK